MPRSPSGDTGVMGRVVLFDLSPTPLLVQKRCFESLPGRSGTELRREDFLTLGGPRARGVKRKVGLYEQRQKKIPRLSEGPF